MSSEFSTKGKTFLITGAATGLGASFAEKFLKEGAKHIAILDISQEAGKATVERFNSEFGEDSSTFYKCDVTDEKALKDTFKKVQEHLGTIDVVINNAGILDDSPEGYRRANEVNWQALVTLSVLAWEHMRRDRGGAGGTLVNISSVAAIFLLPCTPIYNAAKAAVLHFSTCLGKPENYSRSGIRVLCMCFGATSTPLMQGTQDKCMDAVMGATMAGVVQSNKMQSVEAAVEGLVTMVRLGKSGGVWVAAGDKPVKDITTNIEAAYAEIVKALPAL